MSHKISYLVATSMILLAPSAGAETATFTPIDNAYSLGVSENGEFVVGPSVPNDPNNAFRWDVESSTNLLLGYLPGGFPHSTAFGVSSDGAVVVGITAGNSYLDQLPARFTEATGWMTLGAIPGSMFRGNALGISDDGTIIVGWVRMADGNTRQAFRWTAKTGMVGLGLGAAGSSVGHAISADGTTIVGKLGVHAMRWTEAGGMVDLGTLGGSYSEAHAVSADGSVIVGQATESFQDPIYDFPFKWQNGFMVKLGTQPGRAFSVSGDGQTIVGHTGPDAFIWDSANGVRNLRNVLVNEYGLGTELAGWSLHEATAISTDGNTIVGWGASPQGQTRGWIVRFETPMLLGDLNNDSVVDEDDRALLCSAMGASIGEPNYIAAADLNDDSVIDHLDQQLFNELLPPCAGDVVSSITFQPPADGATDAADLAYLLGAWGNQPSCADFVTSRSFAPPPDGKVDGADLAYLLGAWGACE
jgi:probable HAF family extracellular repeat protein